MSEWTLNRSTMKWERPAPSFSAPLPTPKAPQTTPTTPQVAEKASTMPQNEPTMALKMNLNSDQVDSLTGIIRDSAQAIMKAEGVSAVQSGRKETYGFREGNPGYKEVSQAVQKFGANSEQATNAVAGQLSSKLKVVGLPNVTDAGMIGAIMSVAHMRGDSGARAILNSVGLGSDKIEFSRKDITPEALNAINGMSAGEFHTKLRQARELYDKTHYWNRTDSIKMANGNTQTGRWGDLFGKGLINRYNDEYKTFSRLSGGSPTG